jgi:SAM-dependent methyltransferase
MGRFATTAPLYEEFRPPYPAEFFRVVAQKLGFSKAHALIDLGTGPGLLALGFAPYVGPIVGVDPEPAMLAAAKRAASRASQSFTLIESRAEALSDDIGPFDMVTIGRALHWIERTAVVRLFERLVAPKGVIVVCSARSVADGRNPWLQTYNDSRRFWSGSEGGGRHSQLLPSILRGSRFELTDVVNVESTHEIRASDLAQRMLTFSSSSPDVLGDKVGPMLHDVERRLAPLSRDGHLTEIVVSMAQVVRRRDG